MSQNISCFAGEKQTCFVSIILMMGLFLVLQLNGTQVLPSKQYNVPPCCMKMFSLFSDRLHSLSHLPPSHSICPILDEPSLSHLIVSSLPQILISSHWGWTICPKYKISDCIYFFKPVFCHSPTDYLAFFIFFMECFIK